MKSRCNTLFGIASNSKVYKCRTSNIIDEGKNKMG
jgi:hypothetical protein